jgi:hypothetical protein
VCAVGVQVANSDFLWQEAFGQIVWSSCSAPRHIAKAKGYTNSMNDDYPQHLKVIQLGFGFWTIAFEEEDEVEEDQQHEAPQHPRVSRSPIVGVS